MATPAARELLLNSLAVGEAESAVDLDRVAEHVGDPILSRKIYRHFTEEKKHARLFARHLESLGFSVKPLPLELDYEHLVQRFEMGTPKTRLDDPTPFSETDLIRFFVGCKAGEERACAEMRDLIEDLAACGETATAEVLRQIHADEIRHVAYATEALNDLADAGHRDEVLRALRHGRRAEARAHRIVSATFMGRLMTLAGVPAFVRWCAARAIDLQFAIRWIAPGGLDRPSMAEPMPVPAVRREPVEGTMSEHEVRS